MGKQISKVVEQSDPLVRAIESADEAVASLAHYLEVAERASGYLRRQSDCGCCFHGKGGDVVPKIFLAPITGNPQIGIIRLTHPSYTFVADKTSIERDVQGKEIQTWYHIVRVEYEGIDQQQPTGWVSALDLGNPINVSNCADASEQYVIPTIDWNRFAGMGKITFAGWPINPKLLCGGRGIYGIGVDAPVDVDYYRPDARGAKAGVRGSGIHQGADFFVPEELVPVLSVDHGIVVGIGLENDALGLQSHHNWGATQVDDLDALFPNTSGEGYSVIVRYGHLYVLYGHLHEINVWVGKEVQTGEQIGILGKNNERHLHFEVRSYGNTALSEFSEGDKVIDPITGILPVNVTAAGGSAPFIFEPAQFLPDPSNQMDNSFFSTALNWARNVKFTNQFSISEEEEGLQTLRVRLFDDCEIEYQTYIDPIMRTVGGGYRGFVGFLNIVQSDDNMVSPLRIGLIPD